MRFVKKKKKHAHIHTHTCVFTVLHKLGSLLVTPRHTTQLTTYSFKGPHTNLGDCTT